MVGWASRLPQSPRRTGVPPLRFSAVVATAACPENVRGLSPCPPTLAHTPAPLLTPARPAIGARCLRSFTYPSQTGPQKTKQTRRVFGHQKYTTSYFPITSIRNFDPECLGLFGKIESARSDHVLPRSQSRFRVPPPLGCGGSTPLCPTLPVPLAPGGEPSPQDATVPCLGRKGLR
jgi:hypothetical protein